MFTNDDVKDTVRGTAVDWGRGGENKVAGATGPDVDYGAGRLDAYAALAAAGADLTSPPTMPQHALREGTLSGTGQVLEYAVDVADTSFPLAVTLIDLPTSCRIGADPDFDMRLTAPNGAMVATATGSQRQDEFGYRPLLPGVYKLRVYSYRDCGAFFVDVSGGSVSSVATANPDPDKPVDTGGGGTTPATPAPATPSASGDEAAVAAVVNAARVTASRAGIRARVVGLRRLLRRGRFTLAGMAPTAGRIELAVRMNYRGKRVIVARGVRRVTAAGQPRVSVRLTRAGRRLLRTPRSVRLTVRAAVTDSSKRRRYADRVVRVRR